MQLEQVVVCVSVCICLVSALDDGAVVTLTTGKVEGQKLVSAANKSYFSFRGIPYAAPPVRNLRFKAPQPPQPWNSTRMAFRIPPACAQPSRLLTFPETYSEDCLYVNVFTPHLQPPQGVLMPVMVFIHGGKRYQGSSTSYKYGADFLITQDVLLVTFNYRLGVFGFFTSHSKSGQGNASSKDKVAALRWVQREIRQFGGDPDLVTIFGGSSGGQDVSCLYISPLAQGLFHRAISQSAGGCGAVRGEDPHSAGVKLAEMVGCPTGDAEETVACLRTIDSQVLAEKQLEVTTPEPGALDDKESPFVLNTVEGSHGEEVFIGSSSEELLDQLKTKVPFLMGMNSGEGRMFVRDPAESPTQFSDMEKDFQLYLPSDLQEISNERKTTNEAVQILKTFYFGNESISLQTIYGFVHYMMDSKFAYPIVREAVAVAKHAPVYLYLFTFEGEFSTSQPITDAMNLTGVGHGHELGYLFYRSVLIPQQNHMDLYPRESVTLTRMVRLWSNFAKHGNPTPTLDPLLGEVWLPVNGSRTHHLVIDDSLRMVPRDLLSDRMSVWDAVYHLKPREQEAQITVGIIIIMVVAGLALASLTYLMYTSSCRRRGYMGL